MATQVAGNVNADHEISSQQRNNQQATSRIRHNTMEHADGNFKHNNSSGEGVSGPPDGAVNNVLGSPGQPPGGGGPDIGTKAAAMNANMNQDGGQQQSRSMNTQQQPGSNSNMDPYSSGGGGMQPNSNMPNQLMDNSGGKPGTNMSGTEGYNGGYYGNRSGNYGSMVGQHGGHGQAGNVPPNSNLNTNMGPNQGSNMPNNSYSPYDGHMGTRPGYPPMSMGSRTGPNVPPTYGGTHQRPYGETRSIANSAPTLSQLLQGQKHSPSYPSNYSNQGDNLGKGNDPGGGMGMMGNPAGYPSQWGQRGGMSSMGHMDPGAGHGGYGPNMMRNQMSMMPDGPMGQKRGYPGGSPYPQPNQYGGRQFINMPGNYPGGARGQNMPPSSMAGGNQQYSHQNMPPQNHQQQQQPNQTPNQQQQGPGFGGRGQQPQSRPTTPAKPPTPNQAQPPQNQNQQPQNQQPQQQQQQQQQQGQQQQTPQKPTPQQPPQNRQPQQQQQQQSGQPQPQQNTNDDSNSSNRPPSLPDLSGSLDDLTTGNEYNQNLQSSNQTNNTAPSSQANNDSYSTSSSSQSPHMHPSVSALRPSPSPVGSPASHLSRSSLSPSSVPGGPVTPQPPMVPPSSQSDSSSHNQLSQSPVGSQPDNRGAVATTVTQSITSPVATSTVSTSNSNSNSSISSTVINQENEQQPQLPNQQQQMPNQQQQQMPNQQMPNQQPQMPNQQQQMPNQQQQMPNQQQQMPNQQQQMLNQQQGQLQPQQVQLVKEESGYGPSSPPIGLLGASPAPLASPGATSKSSQDEGDSRGSPSVSKIPASPVSRAHAGTTSRRSSKNLTSQDVMQRQAELDDHPERRPFLERVFSLMEERNQPIKTMPQISTHTLDLFKLYHAVRERGGVLKVSKGKQWKAIATYLAVGSSNSAAFTLKKNYLRYLLQFECVNDLGNCDPQRIVVEIESMTKKKGSSSSSSSAAASAVDHSAAGQQGGPPGGQHNMMPLMNSHDGFPRPGPGGRVNQMYPGQPPMPNNMSGMHPRPGMGPGMGPTPGGMPGPGMGPTAAGMPNDMGGNSVTVRDPFADNDYSNAQQQGQFPGMGPQNSMDGPYRPGMNSMNQFRNNSPMPGNDPYSAMGNRGPQGNDPYNSGMRNSGMPPQGSGPYNRPNMGPAAATDGFNNRTPNSGAETFTGNNRSGSLPQGGSTGQFPYGSGSTPFDREGFDQQRQHMAPSPSSSTSSQPPGQMPPFPNNSGGDQTMYPPSSRYGGPQGSGSRPGTPSDSHTRPPFANNQQQQSPQQGMFPGPGNDQMRPQFPQKRPNEMYGPGKRPDYMNQQPPMSRTDDYRALTPFSQSSNFPPQQGNFPGDRGPHSYPPSYRDRGPGATGHGLGSSPFGDYQPNLPPSGPGPLMGLLADDTPLPAGALSAPPPPPPPGPWSGAPPPPRWNESLYPFPPNQGHSMRPGPASGASPSPSWGTMVQRHPSPYSGPNSGGPRTLQQALMAAAHRGREHNKMMGKPSPPPMPAHQMPPKKEIVFPPDSVEATQPKLTRSRRKNSKDIGPVEAWRLMMSLKSGLLAESTWALDVLNILLYDNSTIMYFDLAQLQGLLEILVDHFRASLKQVFDTFDDLEVRTHDNTVANFTWEEVGVDMNDLDEDTRKRRKDGPESELEIVQQAVSDLDIEKLRGADKVKTIGIEESMIGFYEHSKNWDNFEGFLTNQKHWNDGKGDMTGHIMHVFADNERTGEPPAKTRRVDNEDTEDASSENEWPENEITCKVEPEENNDDNSSKTVVKLEPEEVRIKVEPVDIEDGDRTKCKSPSIDDENEDEIDEEDDEEDISSVPLWQRCCSEELRSVKKKEREDASKGMILCYQNTAQNEHDPPLEEEGTCRDNSVLVTCTDGHKELTKRCQCLSNIVRSLSFIPGNDTEMANHPGLLSLLGRLLLLQHRHGIRKRNPQTYNREEKDDLDLDIAVTDEEKWWWDCLDSMRENAMVTITNISGHLDLSLYPESISLPILDGLLHWSICLSANAVDPFPSRRNHSLLSPKRLAIEALAKLSIQDNNVDMILATPPFQRLDRFFATLTQYLGDRKKPVMREFSIVLLSSLAQGDSIASRAIAQQNSIISLLLCYMEDSEYAKTLEGSSTASQLSQNPDIQPASPDMMRRAALTLACLAREPENKLLFLQHQGRLLNLNMSHVVHDVVKKHLSDVLFEVGKEKL